MLLNLLEYHWVEDIDEALLLIARTDTKTVPLAGGTYLLGLDDQSIQGVVDLLTALAVLDAEVLVLSGAEVQVELSVGWFGRGGCWLGGGTYNGKHERLIPCKALSLEHGANELLRGLVRSASGSG